MYQWTKDLETGNVTIDSEHKELIREINTLLDACAKGKGRSEIKKTLDFLSDYVSRHFAHEEKEMQAKGYDSYDSHKAEHEKLVAVCADLQKKFHAGSAEVTDEVGQMVKGWLDHHIPTFDKAYAGALNS